MPDNQEYFSAFGETLLFIIGGILFVTVALTVSKLVRPDRPNVEKLTTYESGEEPSGPAWAQFNVRFYIVALVFLLFEVELIFFFPWATIFARKELIEQTHGTWGWLSMVEMMIFVVILALGLAYAWVNGYLDWIKPTPSVTDVKSKVPKELYDNVNKKYES